MERLLLVSLPLLAWLWIVRRARYQRINEILQNYAGRHSLTAIPPLAREGKIPSIKDYPMTPREAQEILQMNGTLEFPYAISTSLAFALFKTYGIESIASVLQSTGELSKTEKSSKRFMDTSVIISTFIQFPLNGPGSGALVDPSLPLDPRAVIAVARMNWLHSKYKSRISNQDLLYTLSVFILSPAAWCAKYEFRNMTPLEEIAWFVFFKEIGRRMDIVKIWDDLDDCLKWTTSYEEQFMLPSTVCRDVSGPTIKLLLHNVPTILHPIGVTMVSALLDDKLRNSILLPHPGSIPIFLVNGLLRLRAHFILHFCLPRIIHVNQIQTPFDLPHNITPPAPSDKASQPTASDINGSASTSTNFAPKSQALLFDNVPYYVATSTGFKARWESVLLKLGILSVDQIPSKRWESDGYRLENLGPVKFEGKGMEEIKMEAEKLLGEKISGAYAVGGMRSTCPMKQ